MAVFSSVNVFTSAMRSEFNTAYEAVPVQAPYEAFTSTFQSDKRFEFYDWISATPSIQRYLGQRSFAQLSNVRYRVDNLEYQAGFEVLLRDIQDVQLPGGYLNKPKELAMKAKEWPGRVVYQTMAQGHNLACFDGTNMFATTHTLGGYGSAPSEFASGGGNKFVFNTTAYNGGSGDTTVYNVFFLIHTGMLKPMCFQWRKAPELLTDSGTPQSQLAKLVHFWIDLEGAGFFGFWWDAVKVTVNGMPTLTECQTILTGINKAVRLFTLPVAAPGQLAEYVHAQHVFSEQTNTLAVSPGIEIMFRQVLRNEVIVNSGAPVTNTFKGYASLVSSGDLDSGATSLDFTGPN